MKTRPANHSLRRKIFLKRILPIVVLVTFIASTAIAGTVAIDKNTQKKPIGLSIEYLEDKSASLGIGDVTGRARDAGWKKSEKETPNFGFTTSVYWVRFTLVNKSGADADLYLEQVYPLISHLTLYVPEANGYAATEIGHARPFKERPVDHRSLVFPLKLKNGGAGTYYLAYKTKSAMNIEPIVWAKDAFQTKVVDEAPVLWMFYGILLVMFAYNFVIFLSMRDPAYFYCSLYISSFCLFMMSLTGLAYQYLWPNWPWWSNLAVPFFMGIIIISIIQFARHMGVVWQYSYIIDNILKIIVALAIAVSALTLVINNYRISIISATGLTGIAAGFGAVALFIFVIKYKHRDARNYLFAYLLFLAGVLLYVLKTFGLLPDVFITNHGIEIGAVFNVVALSLALTDRINVMKDNLQELNVNLEDKVKERTEELEAAMEELEVANDTLMDFNAKLEENQRVAAVDMRMAANVQAGMLPRQAPKNAGLDMAFVFKPMAGVSGDFYDFYEVDGKFVGVGIFDVSGHGVASGLITMIARSIFFRNIKAGAGEPLNRVLERSNRDLIGEIGGVDNFITGILLRFSGDSVEYVNAGHADLLIRKGAGGEVGIVDREDGDIKGLFMGAEGVNDSYDALTFMLNTNDILLLYTDCLYEGRNTDEEEYGLARLKASLKNAPDGTAQQVMDHIVKDFYKFIGLKELADDLTVIVIKKM
ncbi:MAG: SpoIIE family protein phosphatase [Spirochaetes bacterium]|nr:SpoIIE family protein phosphatase [Spirochaetota bacterium]